MRDWADEFHQISGIDAGWRKKARQRLKEQTRPEGSLGILESLLERLVAIQKKEKISLKSKRIFIFASDHGIVEEGVSLYPQNVTESMVLNFLNGGATINALARSIQADVKVVDVGVDADFKKDPRLIHAKIRRSTRNMVHESAMNDAELDQALQAGWDLIHQAAQEGIELVGLGEMGIGNTTAASAINSALSGKPVALMTGRGTGLGNEMLLHKIKVIERVHALHRSSFSNPLEILKCMGGYEIAALSGSILAGAKLSLPIIIDGWIVSAAALTAIKLNPQVLDYLFFAHQSEEPGHCHILEMLEAKPILNLSMRLGEASGAALAMGLLESAAAVYNEVATFAEAGVANKDCHPGLRAGIHLDAGSSPA